MEKLDLEERKGEKVLTVVGHEKEEKKHKIQKRFLLNVLR